MTAKSLTAVTGRLCGADEPVAPGKTDDSQLSARSQGRSCLNDSKVKPVPIIAMINRPPATVRNACRANDGLALELSSATNDGTPWESSVVGACPSFALRSVCARVRLVLSAVTALRAKL